MTRDDIIRMALQAGFNEHLWLNPKIDGYEDEVICLEHFAALVAAAEREACAKVCEVHGSMAKHSVWMAEECALLIRARGQG